MPAFRYIYRESVVRSLLIEADTPEEAEDIGNKLTENTNPTPNREVARYITNTAVVTEPINDTNAYEDESPTKIIWRSKHRAEKANRTNQPREKPHLSHDPASEPLRP